MSQIIGNVAIVLNAHFPYVRRAGRWPHGEETLHKVIAESYVPLLNMLRDLRTEGRPLPLTVSASPVLLEQLADPVIAKHFAVWLTDWQSRAAADLERFEAAGEAHGAYLARFYLDWIDAIARSFHNRYGRNLVAALRRLLIDRSEVALAPATYAYLPWLAPDEARVQIDVGAMTMLRHLGRRPTGLWLPGGVAPPALRSMVAEQGIAYAIGAPMAQSSVTITPDGLPLLHPDQALGEYVIAGSLGYPGDSLYREFHRVHDDSGIAYWRVTGADVPLGDKQWYDPYLAFSRVIEHAAHFARAIRERLRGLSQVMRHPTVLLAFDAELFGHWWFEGVRWLQHVLEHLAQADDLRLVRVQDASAMLETAPVAAPVTHPIFDDARLEPLRARLMDAGARMRSLARRMSSAAGLEEDLLSQAMRELLLAQSGDWPTLIATGSAIDYAQRRFDEHLARFDRLVQYVDRDEPTPDAVMYLHEIAELDNVFPFANYRLFSR